jgi:hypothetical protein
MNHLNNVCDNCGLTFGQHYYYNNACPTTGGFHPSAIFTAKTVVKTLFSAQCALCGESFGNHNVWSNACPTDDPGIWSITDFFTIKKSDCKKDCENSCKKDCKPLSTECPCGINRANCDYHK